MPHLQEPNIKRAIAFFDGQNLYRCAKTAFGYTHPNFDPLKLFNAVCQQGNWQNHGVRFYTGTPNQKKSPMWHAYWANRLLAMRRAGIFVASREIRYREEEVTLIGGLTKKIEVAQEKGIDVRIALDVVRLAYTQAFDVAVIFSQDQDLREVADEIREISKLHNKWFRICSAFPVSPTATNSRGIEKTDWIKIDKAFYDRCLDTRDYRPKKS